MHGIKQDALWFNEQYKEKTVNTEENKICMALTPMSLKPLHCLLEGDRFGLGKYEVKQETLSKYCFP